MASTLKINTNDIAEQLTSNDNFLEQIASRIAFDESDVMKHASPHINRIDGTMNGLIAKVGQTSERIKTELTPLADKITALNQRVDEGQKESLNKTASIVAKELTKDKILEALQGSVGRSVLSGVKNGTTLPLPSLRPVATEYCSATSTSELIRRSIKAGRHMMISGPAGSGKTYPLHQELNAIKRRHITISCADGVSYGDLIVRQELRSTPKGNETIWRLGLLPFCMENGIVLVLDEVDQLAPELLQVLNACLESRELLIPATGDVIKATDTWLVGVTLNSLRDDTGVYSGFRVDERTCQRFAFIPADYLPIAEEKKVIESATGVTGKAVDEVVSILTVLRTAHFAGRLRGAPSTRIAIKLIRVMNGLNDENKKVDGAMSLNTALSYCYLGGMPKSQTAEAVQALQQTSVTNTIGNELAKQFSI
jgi:MoxR-like ATPase